MKAIIIAKGTGYADDTTFDAYEVVRRPCPRREDRNTFAYSGSVEPTPADTPVGSIRVTHESHSVALAKEKDGRGGGASYILLEHGGGRRVIRVHTSDDWRAAIMTLPERMAYEVLRTTAAIAEDADRDGAEREGNTWRRAFVNGTIRKSRPKQGRVTVSIAPWYEATTPELKLRRASGEVFEITPQAQVVYPSAKLGFYFFGSAKNAPAYGPYETGEAADEAKGRSVNGRVAMRFTLGEDATIAA